MINNLNRLVHDRWPNLHIQRAFELADRLVRNAERDGAPLAAIERLQAQLLSLKGEGHRQQRELLELNNQSLGQGLPLVAAKENISTAIKAFTDATHWAAKEFRAKLMSIVGGSNHIPDEIKERLHLDVAKVLEVCPHAGGLVVELTARGQRGATGSRSKLGANSNAAIGAAYELMGTAALATKSFPASNQGAPPLYINGQKDVVTFGDKAYLNRRSEDGVHWHRPTRSTIENDLHIGRPTIDGYLEIGVDFKHVKEMRTKHANDDFRNQVENVVWAIKEGQVHEYHFATNGRFSSRIQAIVAEANAVLVASDCTPIGLHEYVSTLVSDPST